MIYEFVMRASGVRILFAHRFLPVITGTYVPLMFWHDGFTVATFVPLIHRDLAPDTCRSTDR
jgi:hypothetical protein